MAKLSRDEFNQKYSEKIVDNDDLLIELMEDISDSISTDESEELRELRDEVERLSTELTIAKEKYKQRFLRATEEEEPEVKEKEELKEEEVIDIKEI